MRSVETRGVVASKPRAVDARCMTAHCELSPEHPRIALVTLSRPEAANALDPATLLELAATWRRIAADPEIRCAVLTGAGSHAFCSGMDMRATIPAAQALARGERIDPEDFEGLRAVSTALLLDFDLGVPLVCAVNGHARAAGLDLMLASEIRYAAPHASFALEEVARGLYPTGHATVLLARQIGWVHACELLLTARGIDAARAREIGLVNDVVPAERLLDTALAAANAIASNAPLAVRATRQGLRELRDLPLREAYRRQEELGKPLRATRDAAEAARAFAEKRPPRWEGA